MFAQRSFQRRRGGRTRQSLQRVQWEPSGQDGQFLLLDRTGKVLGAIGNGMGIGTGQFIEASYWVMDRDHNLYAGDTSVGRVTRMVAPR